MKCPAEQSAHLTYQPVEELHGNTVAMKQRLNTVNSNEPRLVIAKITLHPNLLPVPWIVDIFVANH